MSPKRRDLSPDERHNRTEPSLDSATVRGNSPEPAKVRRLRAALANIMAHPRRARDIIASFGGEFFEGSQEWAHVFKGIAAGRPASHTLIVLALREYLRSLEKLSADEVEQPASPDSNLTPDQLRTGVTGRPVGTQVFTRDSVGQGEAAWDPNFTRLPPRQPTRLSGKGDTIVIWLGGNRCEVRLGPPATFADPGGVIHPLKDGTNFIGRGTYNDVVLDALASDVSREHLIVEVRAGRVAEFTDTSSGGTFVPREAL